jgi:hypothetical protein
MLSLPDVAFDPLQSPLALQMSAFVDDHSISIVSFTNTWDGLINNEAVGLGVAKTVGSLPPPPPPPHDIRIVEERIKLNIVLCFINKLIMFIYI